MEKSVKNAVFKGFPVLMESDTFGSKQGQAAYLPSLFSIDSQLSTKIKNNLQSNFFRGFYLVTKCIKKKIIVGLVASSVIRRRGTFCKAEDSTLPPKSL